MLDALDRKILDVLARDADITAARLAERVGLSPSAAHRRVKLLESGGFITGYRARLSREARGNPVIVFVSVTLRDQGKGLWPSSRRRSGARPISKRRT